MILPYTHRENINLIERLQLAINHLTIWSNQTGFVFSWDKTKSVHICRKTGYMKEAPNL